MAATPFRPEIVDLSVPIDDRVPTYPGDPVPRFCAAHTIANHGFNIARMEMGSHCGTHCDAPYHFVEDGARIDELPLDMFVGTGVVIDVRGRGRRITTDDLGPRLDAVGPGTIVLLQTGWSTHLYEDDYFDHPFLTAEACEALLARGARTIGIDAMNIDETADRPIDRADFPCHRLICEAGGVIVENLTNLDAITFEDPVISVLPLRFAGGDAAPARAVAFRPVI